MAGCVFYGFVLCQGGVEMSKRKHIYVKTMILRCKISKCWREWVWVERICCIRNEAISKISFQDLQRNLCVQYFKF